jgi:hypothetical protein
MTSSPPPTPMRSMSSSTGGSTITVMGDLVHGLIAQLLTDDRTIRL